MTIEEVALIAVSVLGVFGGILRQPPMAARRVERIGSCSTSDDAVFNTGPGQEVVGREALLAQRAERYQGQTGDNGRRHHNSSWVITPTADGGATGRAYWVVLDVSGPQPKHAVSGYYDDVFVKTSDGWRIKSRTLHRDAAP